MNKKLTLILVLVLVLILAVGLVACNKNKGGNDQAAETPSGDVTPGGDGGQGGGQGGGDQGGQGGQGGGDSGKQVPSYITPTVGATYGQTLADLQLPAGFTWDEPLTTSVGNVGSNTFHVTFTPDDPVVYQTVTGIPVTVTVSKGTPDPSFVATVNALYGQTLADVELPEIPGGALSWQEDTATSVGNAGNHDFHVVFTPTDTANLNIVRDIPVLVVVGKVAAQLDESNAVNEYVYDGQPHGLDGYSGTGSVTYESNEHTNAGVYEVTINVAEGDNYLAGTFKRNLTITKAPVEINVNSIITTFVYNGTAQSISGATATGAVSYENNSFINAGSYEVRVLSAESDNYLAGHLDVLVDVQKADVDMSGVVFADGNVVYDGTAKQIAAPTNLPSGVSVTGYSYELADVPVNNPTNAGQYVARAHLAVADTENYNVPQDLYANFLIEKAHPTLTITSDLTKMYDGLAVGDVTYETNSDGVLLNVLYKEYESDIYSSDKPINAGGYYVCVEIAECTNYYFASEERLFGIMLPQTIDINNAGSKVYDGYPAIGIDYTVAYDDFQGDLTVEYKVDGAPDDTYTTQAPVNAGDYIVRVSIAQDAWLRYTAASETAGLLIELADAPEAPNSIFITYGEYERVENIDELPDGWSFSSISVVTNYLFTTSGGADYTEDPVTYASQLEEGLVGHFVSTATYEPDDNHDDFADPGDKTKQITVYVEKGTRDITYSETVEIIPECTNVLVNGYVPAVFLFDPGYVKIYDAVNTHQNRVENSDTYVDVVRHYYYKLAAADDGDYVEIPSGGEGRYFVTFSAEGEYTIKLVVEDTAYMTGGYNTINVIVSEGEVLYAYDDGQYVWELVGFDANSKWGALYRCDEQYDIDDLYAIGDPSQVYTDYLEWSWQIEEDDFNEPYLAFYRGESTRYYEIVNGEVVPYDMGEVKYVFYEEDGTDFFYTYVLSERNGLNRVYVYDCVEMTGAKWSVDELDAAGISWWHTTNIWEYDESTPDCLKLWDYVNPISVNTYDVASGVITYDSYFEIDSDFDWIGSEVFYVLLSNWFGVYHFDEDENTVTRLEGHATWFAKFDDPTYYTMVFFEFENGMNLVFEVNVADADELAALTIENAAMLCFDGCDGTWEDDPINSQIVNHDGSNTYNYSIADPEDPMNRLVVYVPAI
ncbi:MAG: hypothetical protein J5815_00900 [Clostridia bacterium]|nr:hypothetical protein [Clostridia bacterium]